MKLITQYLQKNASLVSLKVYTTSHRYVKEFKQLNYVLLYFFS